jgi:hypothetical protein
MPDTHAVAKAARDRIMQDYPGVTVRVVKVHNVADYQLEVNDRRNDGEKRDDTPSHETTMGLNGNDGNATAVGWTNKAAASIWNSVYP